MTHHMLPLLGWALPTIASAQFIALSIPGDPSCPQCRIEVRKLVTIADVPGARIGRDSRIAYDSLGRFIVVVEPGPRVAIVDARGRFIGFVDWRSSRQDSSARGVIPWVDWSGELHIADGFTQSHYLKSGQLTGVVGRLEGYIPHGTGAVWSVVTPIPSPLPHRTFVMSYGFPVAPIPDSVAVSLAGAYQVDSVRSNDACRDCGDIVVSVTPVTFVKGAVWAAHVDRYRLDLYDGWGSWRRRSITVTNSWLTARDSTAYPPGRMLPEVPRLTGLAFDQNGCARPQDMFQRFRIGPNHCERLLWVAGLTYADSMSRDEATRYHTMIDAIGFTAPYNAVSDSMAQKARMVARTRLPGRLEVLGPGALYQRRQLPDGKWVIDVYLLAVRPS